MAERKRTTKAGPTATEPEIVPAVLVEKRDEAADLKATYESVIAEMQKTIAEMQERLNKTQTAARKEDDVVTLLFIAEVSDKNILELEGYGSFRPGSYLDVPKREFGGKFMSPLARKLIEKRHLLVLNGLTADERVRWNCDYKSGEVLDEKAFDHMLDYSEDELRSMFEALCPEHRIFVARRFITARDKGDNRVTLEKVKAIDKISRENVKDGMLKPVLDSFRAEI